MHRKKWHWEEQAKDKPADRAEKIIKKMNNKNLLLAILFVGFLVTASVVLFSQKEKQTQKWDDDYLKSLYIDDSKNPACPEEFSCCDGTVYKQKECPAYQDCVNNECVKRKCTSECCVLGRFERKECSQGLICEKYECLKPACKNECCPIQGTYREKTCANNLECRNGKCVERKCEKECCEGIQGTEEKKCPEPQLCIRGNCEKPECPFWCCMPNDQDYVEKACPSHSTCVGRVCNPKI